MEQSLMDKLTILADSAKYDVACTSSGVSHPAKRGTIGSCYAPGCCHAFTADGRCVSLLKVLMSNCCAFDCSYCVNRKSNDVPRATFSPRELAELTIEFYRRNYIEGLFLSSAVLGTPDYTTERMLTVLRLLRNEYHFGGYIHAKTIPGTSPELIQQMGYLADRLSVNVELPSEQSLHLLAPDKGRHSIFRPMKQISVAGEESRQELTLYRHAPKFAPAGQSTQMIVGASPETDYHILQLTEESDRMLVAPLRFKSVLLDEMDHVIAAARMGRPASMILKNNSISDRDIILKLQEASCAGVRIDMIVRGICCVRAGVPGKTENLHIRSLVGRYLEHGRIYSFFDGVHTRIYIASGDFLTRNTECRVEVGVRVEDPVLVKKLTDILQLQLRDNVNAREMCADGSYQKVKPAEGEPIVNSQMGMYDLLRNDWTREEPWKSTTPKAAPAEAPAAEKQTAAEGPKAKTPEVPVQEPPKAKGPDFVEAAPATPAPIHLEPTEHPKGGDHFDELEQMLDKKHLPDQPQKPTVVVTAPKKRGLFSQVLGLFKKRK